MISFQTRFSQADSERRNQLLHELPRLLLEFRRLEDLEDLLTDLTFVQVMYEVGLGERLIAYYHATIDLLPGNQDIFGPEMQCEISAELSKAVDSVLRGDANSHPCVCTTEIAIGLHDEPYKKRDPGFAVPKVEWNEELPEIEIELVEAQDGAKTIKLARQTVHEASTRNVPPDGLRSRLQIILSFLKQEDQFLQEFPEEVVPSARNYGEGSLLTKLADKVASEDVRPWLRRDPLPGAPAEPSLKMHCLSASEEQVTSLALSADGRKLVSADQGGRILVWDVALGRGISEREYTEDGAVSEIAISRDASRIVSYCKAFDDHKPSGFRIWSCSESRGNRIRCGDDLPQMSGIDATADGNLIVSLHVDHIMRVWNGQGEMIRELSVPRFHFKGPLRVSSDGRFVACIANRRTDSQPRYGLAVVTDVLSGKCLRVLEGHSGYLTDLQFAGDGEQLFTSSFENCICLWSIRTGHNIRRLGGQVDNTGDLNVRTISGERKDSIEAFRTTVDARAVLTICENSKLVRLYDVKTGEVIRIMEDHPTVPNALALSSDGRIAAVASGSGISTYNLATGIAGDEAYYWQIHKIASDNIGQSVYAQASNGKLLFWNAATGKETYQLPAPSETGCVVSSSAGDRVVTASNDEILTWRFDRREPTKTILNPSAVAKHLAISPNGESIVCCAQEMPSEARDYSVPPFRLFVLDLASSQQTSTALIEANGIFNVSHFVALPDNRSCVVGASARLTSFLMRVDLYSGTILNQFKTASEITSLASSSDGRAIAFGLSDLSLHVNDSMTGESIYVLWNHSARVQHICFSPDGRHLASSSTDGRVCFWDLSSGELETILAHNDDIVGTAFSPDSRYLITAGKSGVVYAWQLYPIDCVARYNSGSRLGESYQKPCSIVRVGSSWKFAVAGESGRLHLIELQETQRKTDCTVVNLGRFTCPRCQNEATAKDAVLAIQGDWQRERDTQPLAATNLVQKMNGWCPSCRSEVQLFPSIVIDANTGQSAEQSSDEQGAQLPGQHSMKPQDNSSTPKELRIRNSDIEIDTKVGKVLLADNLLSEAANWSTFKTANSFVPNSIGGPSCISCDAIHIESGLSTRKGWVCRDCIIQELCNYELAAEDFSTALQFHAPISCKLLAIKNFKNFEGSSLRLAQSDLVEHLWYEEKKGHPLSGTIRQYAIDTSISIGESILDELIEREENIAWRRSDYYGINAVIAMVSISPESPKVLARLKNAGQRPREDVRSFVPILIHENQDRIPDQWIEETLRSMAEDESDRVRRLVRQAHKEWKKSKTPEPSKSSNDDAIAALPSFEALAALPWSACVGFAARFARVLQGQIQDMEYHNSEHLSLIHRAVVAVGRLSAEKGQKYSDEYLRTEVKEVVQSLTNDVVDAEISESNIRIENAKRRLVAVEGILNAFSSADTSSRTSAASRVVLAVRKFAQFSTMLRAEERTQLLSMLSSDFLRIRDVASLEAWSDDHPIDPLFFGEDQPSPDTQY